MSDVPNISGLLSVLKRAQTAVPAVKYALGVVGIAAAAALIVFFLGRTRTSIILIALMFLGMVCLFLFANLVSTKNSKSTGLAAHIFLWTITISISAIILLSVTAITIKWPPGLVDFLYPASQDNTSELLQDIANKEDLLIAQSAIRQVLERCGNDCEWKSRIVTALKSSLIASSQIDRQINPQIINALKTVTNNNLSAVIHQEFVTTELVGVSFSSTDLRGLSFVGGFLVLSSFEHADLTRVNFSDSSIRGVEFRDAVFHNTDLSRADWFNSFGLTSSQMKGFSGEVAKCPKNYRDTTFSPFIKYINDKYAIQYENYQEAHRDRLKSQWEEYISPGGLCDVADSLGLNH